MFTLEDLLQDGASRPRRTPAPAPVAPAPAPVVKLPALQRGPARAIVRELTAARDSGTLTAPDYRAAVRSTLARVNVTRSDLEPPAVVPVCQMSPAELTRELGRQASRLRAHETLYARNYGEVLWTN